MGEDVLPSGLASRAGMTGGTSDIELDLSPPKLIRGSYVNSASAWVFPPIIRLRPANKDPHLGMGGVSWQRAGEARSSGNQPRVMSQRGNDTSFT